MSEIEPFDLTEEGLKEYIKKLLVNTGKQNSLRKSNPSLFLFMKKLLLNHPDKERKGVLNMIDIKFKLFDNRKPIKDYSDIQVIVVTPEKEESISWSKSVTGIDNCIEQKLYRALRYSIKNQIYNYKNNVNTKKCELCNKTTDLTVDHIIKFRKLFKEFIIKYPLYPKLFDKGIKGQDIFRKQDIEYEKLWLSYHKENATLQILCYDCNISLEK